MPPNMGEEKRGGERSVPECVCPGEMDALDTVDDASAVLEVFPCRRHLLRPAYPARDIDSEGDEEDEVEEEEDEWEVEDYDEGYDDEEENDECEECDGDGSCIQGILTNMSAMQVPGDHTVRTQTVNTQGITFIEESSMVGGRRLFQHTPKDLFSLLNRNKGCLSVPWMCQKAPMTLLHAAVIHQRTDMIGVLVDCGLLLELWDCPLRDQTSPHLNKTAMEIAEKMAQGVNKMAATLKLQKSVAENLGWLHRCARDGNMIAIEKLVDDHPRLVSLPAVTPATALPPAGVQCHTGTEPVFWAVTSGSSEAVNYLLSMGANVRSTSNEGETLLTHASSLGHHDIVKLLVEDYRVDANEPGFEQRTALQLAVLNRDVGLVKLLMDLGANVSETLLNDVAQTGHLGLFAELRDLCSNLDAKDEAGRFPLYHAIVNDKRRMAEELIKAGAKLNLKDKQQRSLLHLVVSRGDMDLFEFVVKHLNKRTKGQKKSVLSELLNERDLYLGAEQCFLVRGRDQKQAAYHYVNAQRFYLSIFRQITREGGAMDVAHFGTVIQSGWGATPPADVVAAVERRFDVKKVRKFGRADLTPLNLAILKGSHEMALGLIKYGADVHLADSFGLTPLHMACMQGSLEVVKALESAGASADVVDNEGRRPLEAAVKNKHTEVINFLKGKSVVKFDELSRFRDTLQSYLASLGVDQLEAVRAEGQDVKKRLEQNLREICGEVEKLSFLLDLDLEKSAGRDFSSPSPITTNKSQCASQH